MGKQNKHKKPLISNNAILWIKLIAAFILFFCCIFFLVQQWQMFLHDIASWMVFFPILYFAGTICVAVYISFQIWHIDEKNNAKGSDRFDIWYRIIFTVTFLLLLIRSFLGDFMGDGTTLNVPYIIIIPALVSGIMTWACPKIRYNNSNDF